MSTEADVFFQIGVLLGSAAIGVCFGMIASRFVYLHYTQLPSYRAAGLPLGSNDIRSLCDAILIAQTPLLVFIEGFALYLETTRWNTFLSPIVLVVVAIPKGYVLLDALRCRNDPVRMPAQFRKIAA